MSRKIYIAAPLFTPEERDQNTSLAAMLERYHHEVCLPQNLEIGDDGASGIQRADLKLLDSCDCVLAVCNGAEVDSGTAFEVGYAYAQGKNVLIYRSDKRPYFNAMIKGMPNHVSTIEGIVDYFIDR